jgi:polyisoprenoid-binding protein YceI
VIHATLRRPGTGCPLNRRRLLNRPRVLAAVIVLALAIGVGGYIAYDQVLRGDSIAPLALPSSEPATAGASTAHPTAGTVTSSGSAPSADPGGGSGGIAGAWSITTGSQAGYRVREQLANLPAESDAVGRTDQVGGTITITADGSTVSVTAGTIQVDTTTITSDRPQRDNRLRGEGLQTDSYPTASFALTQPLAIPAAAMAGTSSDVTLVGDLTLHGVTKSVRIPAKAQFAGGTIQVAGSISFPLSDYGMVAPNIGGFIVSIADQGTLEFVVVFARR